MKMHFIARDKLCYDLWPKPVLASENKPAWYSKLDPYIGGEVRLMKMGNSPALAVNPTMKQCMPLYDLLTAGYHILLPSDVFIDRDSTGKMNVVWSESTPALIGSHPPEQVAGYPFPKNYLPVPYKWDNAWIIKTPPGWSCLFQHPAWHDHLPFKTLPALVDTDKFDIPVRFPFLLDASFSGLIPRNTPIAQVIPVKREDTSATYTWDKNEEYKSKYYIFFSTLFQTYKRFVRQPKNYSVDESKESKCPFSIFKRKE